MNAAVRSVDFVARLAEAWDMDGRHCFSPGGGRREHRALLVMAGLDLALVKVPWRFLEEYQRRALVVAARQAVELGRACAWVFGEGEGARS
jgi:hypothetical protein